MFTVRTCYSSAGSGIASAVSLPAVHRTGPFLSCFTWRFTCLVFDGNQRWPLHSLCRRRLMIWTWKMVNSESMACSTSSYILQFRETDGRISIQLAQLKRHTVMPTSNVRPMSKEAREVGLGRELRCQNGGSGRISNKRVSRNRVLWWHVWHTVDGRNPAPVDRWFTPIIYRVSTIQGGAGFLPSTVCDMLFLWKLIQVATWAEFWTGARLAEGDQWPWQVWRRRVQYTNLADLIGQPDSYTLW